MIATIVGKPKDAIQPIINIAVIEAFLEISGIGLVSARIALPHTVVHIIVILHDCGYDSGLHRIPNTLRYDHQPEIFRNAREDHDQRQGDCDDERKA